MTVHITRGHIRFEPDTTEEYQQLVENTLEESEFIETSWYENKLLISEPARSVSDARADASEHAGEMISALQDGDAPEDLLDEAERVFTKVNELNE